MKQKLLLVIRREKVLSAALLLAVLSSFLTPPDKEYLEYLDFRVLALLFSLMTVVAGLRNFGILDAIAGKLIKRTASVRGLAIILTMLCFFSSMAITNDVSLISFVPLAIILLKKAGQDNYIIPVVIFQTVSANLGSMLTPIGNPQNLYIYTAYNMQSVEFLKLMAPYTVISLVMIIICCLLIKNKELKNTDNFIREEPEIKSPNSLNIYLTVFYLMLFVLSILTVLRIINFIIPAAVALLGGIILDRKSLKTVDYYLLLTFICFFIFIGNIGRIDAIKAFLQGFLEGNELIMGFLSSQVISNVPAVILLSGFTENYRELLAGVNIGGLGTLIASLASLISYKLVAVELPDKKGKYILHFTLINVIFALVLLLKGIL